MKKITKRLISATGMLLISAVMLVTTSYAWFTINKQVNVTGINLKVKTSSNILISKTNVDDSTFVDKLTDSWYALLEPVSTIDGETYYYTLDGAADGHKIHGPNTENPYAEYSESAALEVEDTYADKAKYDEAFNHAYGITSANPDELDKYLTAYGYFDYSFYLKVNSAAAGQDLIMNRLNLLYNGEEIEEKAWRSAVFIQEVAGGTEVDTTGDLITILKPEDAEYQTDGGVNSPTTVDEVTNLDEPAILDTMSANQIKYYKVIVRIWIEGEDTTCTTSVFSTKTEEYTIDMSFSIDEDEEPITAIGSEEE